MYNINIEARSRNSAAVEKEQILYVCLCVRLLACDVINGAIFRKKKSIKHKMCVLIFSTTLV